MSSIADEVPKILIVDDVEVNRINLKRVIEDMGYKPVLAESGAQALRIVERLHPQLLLLDISMPDMDGFEVCTALRSDVKTREIPIIFISAFDGSEDIVKGIEVGGNDYIVKPFIAEVVKARVNMHLNLYQMTKELVEANRKLHTSVREQLRQIEQEKKNVLYALAIVARENSFYEEQYMDRVSYNCKILSQAMQLSPKFESKISDFFIDTIAVAAPLCDIGNVSVPVEILQKTSALTEEEIETMRKHTVTGARLLHEVSVAGDYNDSVQMSEEIAHYHHENWDGSGYPEQLSGDDIPLSAQIVALVSVFCALTEQRSYRGAFTREEAFEVIEKERGTKFSPDVFDICKKISRQLK